MFEHIVKLRSISRFAAPDNRKVTPVIIPPNEECIEVLTGGTLFFEVDGERRTFRKGTIFWHVSRDYTIWDTPLNDPYRCQVFHFVTKQPNRTVPRVPFWREQFVGTGGLLLFGSSMARRSFGLSSRRTGARPAAPGSEVSGRTFLFEHHARRCRESHGDQPSVSVQTFQGGPGDQSAPVHSEIASGHGEASSRGRKFFDQGDRRRVRF